jgi:curved DNA-binding protein CbpA
VRGGSAEQPKAASSARSLQLAAHGAARRRAGLRPCASRRPRRAAPALCCRGLRRGGGRRLGAGGAAAARGVGVAVLAERRARQNMSAQDGAPGTSAPDYYALLNVPRHASREEVKAAYTRLARALHPDKRQPLRDPAREAANELFILVDRAYKVLGDDTERAVYDAYGPEGLRALHNVTMERERERVSAAERRAALAAQAARLSPGELGFVDERGVALRERILGRAQLEREIEAVARYNVRGAVQLSVDGRGLLGAAKTAESKYDIYDAPDGGEPRWYFAPPQITGCVVQQSVDAALSRKDRLTLGAHVVARGGGGNHQASASWEHQLNERTGLELALSNATRDPLSLSTKVARVIGTSSKGTIEFVLRNHFSSGLNVQAQRKLSDTITGVLQLGFGVEQGLVLQLQHQDRFTPPAYKSKREQEDDYYRTYHPAAAAEHAEQRPPASPPQTTSSAHEGGAEQSEAPPRTQLSSGSAMLFASGGGVGLHCTWARSIGRRSLAKVGLKLTAANAELELTSSRTLSAHSKGNVTLTLGLTGVALTVRYERGGMRYVVPMLLTQELSIGAALVAGAVPAAVGYAVNFLLRPLRARRRARERFELLSSLADARKKARLQMQLVQQQSELRAERNDKAGGLVILAARYGCKLHRPCDWRDVRLPALEHFVLVEGRPRAPSDWDVDDDAVDQQEAASATATAPPAREQQLEGSAAAPAAVDSGESEFAEHPPNIDVTVQLNFMAGESSLAVHGGATKAQMLGFYNPCLARNGVEPELYVRYKLGQWVYEVTCDDIEPLELPSRRAVLLGNVADKARMRLR